MTAGQWIISGLFAAWIITCNVVAFMIEWRYVRHMTDDEYRDYQLLKLELQQRNPWNNINGM